MAHRKRECTAIRLVRPRTRPIRAVAAPPPILHFVSRTHARSIHPRKARLPSNENGDPVMTSVAQILNSKTGRKGSPERPVLTIDADASVFEAVKMMAEFQIGALVVMEGSEIAGIVTERDYARKIVLVDRSSKTTPVSVIMTRQVRYVTPADSTEQCMALMTEHRMRHLPVLDDGRLVGMVSIGDLVKTIISDQQFTIQQLEHYITGARS